MVAPAFFTVSAIDRICSWLSTEHGPEIKATCSVRPTFTLPIGTDEAPPRNSYAASVNGQTTGMTDSLAGQAASAVAFADSDEPIMQMITRDAPLLICTAILNL